MPDGRAARAALAVGALLGVVLLGYLAARYVVWARQARTEGWVSALGIAAVAVAAVVYATGDRR